LIAALLWTGDCRSSKKDLRGQGRPPNFTVKHRTLSPLAKLFIDCARSVVQDSELNATAQ
jgi:hypothetical protein